MLINIILPMIEKTDTINQQLTLTIVMVEILQHIPVILFQIFLIPLINFQLLKDLMIYMMIMNKKMIPNLLSLSFLPQKLNL